MQRAQSIEDKLEAALAGALMTQSLDNGNRITFINDAHQQLSGYCRSDLMGLGWTAEYGSGTQVLHHLHLRLDRGLAARVVSTRPSRVVTPPVRLHVLTFQPRSPHVSPPVLVRRSADREGAAGVVGNGWGEEANLGYGGKAM